MNKIQSYLVANYPTTWNMRLVPMLILVFFANLIFGLIGYAIGGIDFTRTYHEPYYWNGLIHGDNYRDYASISIISIFIAIFIFLLWFTFYKRNNRLETYYPVKTKQIYGEWLRILLMISLISLFPFSISTGILIREQSTVNKQELQAALRTLKMAKVLITDNFHDYKWEPSKEIIIEIPDSMLVELCKLSEDEKKLFSTDNNNGLHKNGYVGPSLLYYNAQSQIEFYKYPKIYGKKGIIIKDTIVCKVLDWLRYGQTDSIRAVMKAFDQLAHKHNLVTEYTLTPDQWFERIYHPPFFAVTNENRIYSHNIINYDYISELYNNHERYYDFDKKEYYVLDTESGDTIVKGDNTETINDYYKINLPTLPLNELEAGYNYIYDSQNIYKNPFPYLLLTLLYISTMLSLMVFSFRLTNGKSWLTAFIISGLLFFIILFLPIAAKLEPDYVISSWLIIFVSLLLYLIYHLKVSKVKRLSYFAVNTFLWLMPCVIPLSFALMYLYFDRHTDNSGTGNFLDEYIVMMFWINLLFTILVMYPVTALLRSWKGLAEE